MARKVSSINPFGSALMVTLAIASVGITSCSGSPQMSNKPGQNAETSPVKPPVSPTSQASADAKETVSESTETVATPEASQPPLPPLEPVKTTNPAPSGAPLAADPCRKHLPDYEPFWYEDAQGLIPVQGCLTLLARNLALCEQVSGCGLYTGRFEPGVTLGNLNADFQARSWGGQPGMACGQGITQSSDGIRKAYVMPSHACLSKSLAAERPAMIPIEAVGKL